MIKVCIVDDQTIVREGIATLLELSGRVQVVAQADSGEVALQKIPGLDVDVILMDIRMPGLSGSETLRQLKQQAVTAPVILLTTFNDRVAIAQGIDAGAQGCLLKDVSQPVLLDALAQVAAGQSLLTEAQLQQAKQSGLSEPLTEREQQVLQCIARGLSNKDIAASLFLSEGTVKNNASILFAKLGVKGRTQALLKAREWLLVD